MRAGEKGLRIFGPVTRRLRADEVASWLAQGRDPFDPDGRPRLVVRGFTVEHVFDLSQVDPGPDAQPLPDTRPWTAQRGDGPAGLWPALVAMTETHGFTLDVRPARSEDGGAHGWTDYATRTVWVNSDCDEAERVRILAHETAGHIRCDHEHRRHISRGQRETEADSVAYVVLAALGLDISSSTVEYVADWSQGDPQVLRAAAETVHRVAAAVLADLDHDDPRERPRPETAAHTVLVDASNPVPSGQQFGNNEEGPQLSAPAPVVLGQWAAWKASTTVFEIRPRSETSWPFCRAHARIAAVCSRSSGCGRRLELAVIFGARRPAAADPPLLRPAATNDASESRSRAALSSDRSIS